MRRILLAALTVLAPLAAPVAAQDAPVVRAQTGALSRLVVRETPVPRYTTEFAGPDGGAVSMADFEGRIVFVNFWATWCAPCLKEMPSIDRLAAAMEGEDFAVVTIATDRGAPDRPRAWLENNGIETLRFYHDPTGALPREAGVPGIPLTLLLDRQGREVARYLGDAEWDSDEAKAIIAAMIAQDAS